METNAAELLIASPMCAAFSTLQNLNYSKMTAAEVREKVRVAMDHLDFALELCEMQARAGRIFMFEHPVAARSWSPELVRRFYKYNKVTSVDFDFCQLGMHFQGYPVKKRTRLMTNPPCIANRLARFQCPGGHGHVPLMNGRAGPCQIYHRKFCTQVCLGLKDELAKRAPGRIDNVAKSVVDPILELLSVYEAHPYEEKVDMSNLYSGKDFFDDVHGKLLNKEMATEARRLEIEFFKKMGVCTKIPRAQAVGKIITTRWIDTDKGNEENPNYRATLVGKEFTTDARLRRRRH